VRQKDGQRLESEQLDARDVDPKRERRLVDRDEATWIERSEHEVVPVCRHAAHGRCVVLVAPPTLPRVARSQRQCDRAKQQEAREIGAAILRRLAGR
jgi:hypothetical protein